MFHFYTNQNILHPMFQSRFATPVVWFVRRRIRSVKSHQAHIFGIVTYLSCLNILAFLGRFLISLCYNASSMQLGRLGLNIYSTYSVAIAFEFPVNIVCMLALDTLGRRWPNSCFMLIGGVTSLAIGLFRTGKSVIATWQRNRAIKPNLKHVLRRHENTSAVLTDRVPAFFVSDKCLVQSNESLSTLIYLKNVNFNKSCLIEGIATHPVKESTNQWVHHSSGIKPPDQRPCARV